MHTINRRRLLASVAVAALLYGQQAESALFLRGGGAVSNSPGANTTITFVNTSGSTSPSGAPVRMGKMFARGAVPSGSIAVPKIGGVALSYQCDNRTFWDDGSLRTAVYRMLMPSINASGTSQVTFAVETGSWVNTSANTVADVTGSSDYKVAISNCHTAQVGAANSQGAGALTVVALTMAGGVITGGTVHYPSNLTVGNTSVSQGNGTGAVISVTAGVLNVVTPGSGYSNVGTGSFVIGFNDGVTIVNGSGNYNGASLIQYAKGPVCDAWRVRVPIPSLPHAYAAFYIERWKNSGGAFLAFLASAVVGNGLVDTTHSIFNYTYDLDWKNGSTVIRGASLGSPGFTNMLHFAAAACGTFDETAQEDWSTNDTAYKAINQQWTPAECDQIKAAGVIMPWLAEAPAVTVPTTPAAYETGFNGGISVLCLHHPFGSAGIRSPLGNSGTGNQEGNLAETNALHWRALRTGTAGYQTWAQNNRVSAAHSLGTCQLGSAFLEPITMRPPNTVPASAQVFTGMTPTRQNSSVGDITLLGYVNNVVESSGNPALTAGIPYHQVNCTYYPAVVEGAQWMVDALTGAATNCLYCTTYAFRRQATLGSTTYYGIWAANMINVRVAAWPNRTQGYAVTLMPTTWADGAANVEQAYLLYCTKNYFDYLNALIPFIGNVTMGSGGAANAKTTDLTGSGCWPEMFNSSQGANVSECTVPFMDDYIMMVCAHLAFLFQGTAIGNSIATFRDYWKLYYVGLWAYPGSHYLNDSYRIRVLDGPPPSLPSDPTWTSIADVSNPKLAVWSSGNSGSTPLLTFTSGNPIVSLNLAIFFRGTTQGNVRFASGSRIRLTRTSIGSTTGGARPAPPTNFDTTTWYYWNELTSTTGQLCSDAALTTPVVPGSSVAGVDFWIVPANALPADNSGIGTFNGGTVLGGASRIGTKLGVMRLCKAMGMNDSPVSVTDAITNCAAIFNSLPGQVGFSNGGGVQYGWDSSLT